MLKQIQDKPREDDPGFNPPTFGKWIERVGGERWIEMKDTVLLEKKLLETSATLVVTSALLVVTKSY